MDATSFLRFSLPTSYLSLACFKSSQSLATEGQRLLLVAIGTLLIPAENRFFYINRHLGIFPPSFPSRHQQVDNACLALSSRDTFLKRWRKSVKFNQNIVLKEKYLKCLWSVEQGRDVVLLIHRHMLISSNGSCQKKLLSFSYFFGKKRVWQKTSLMKRLSKAWEHMISI